MSYNKSYVFRYLVIAMCQMIDYNISSCSYQTIMFSIVLQANREDIRRSFVLLE